MDGTSGSKLVRVDIIKAGLILHFARLVAQNFGNGLGGEEDIGFSREIWEMSDVTY